jgi:hypothetical protein
MTLHELMVVELVKAVDPIYHQMERDAHAICAQRIQRLIAKKGPLFFINITPNDSHKIDIYV